jgi:hypothetical protein
MPVADVIDVSTGGAIVVTEELSAAAAVLHALASEAAGIRADLLYADRVVSTAVSAAPAEAHAAENEIDRAATALLLVEAEARFVALSLDAAAGGYVLAEEASRRLMGTIVDQGSSVLGMVAPLLVVPLLWGGVGLALAGPEGRNAFFSNPLVVKAIRALASGADDAMLSRLGIPPQITAILGDHGLDLAGIPLVATTIAGLGRAVGLLKEGQVRVTREEAVEGGPTQAPSGFQDRFDRIPIPAEDGGSQVLIETYEMPDGSMRYEVYVAATVDFDPAAVGQPWDMASNVSNAIGPGSGSYDSVVAAMERAGIGPDDPVQFTGYSQGAGTAAQLAASGEFATQGLVTFGGNTGQVPIPPDVPTVIVEHTDDLVAALGGTQDNTHAVIVERWASQDTDFSTAPILPGHQRPGYIETAGLMDASDESRLVSTAATLKQFGGDGRLVASVAYTCERVYPDAQAAGDR